MSDDNLDKKADEKAKLLKHLYRFIGGNIFLIIVNAIVTPNDWWFYWFSAIWAIGLIPHIWRTYVN